MALKKLRTPRRGMGLVVAGLLMTSLGAQIPGITPPAPKATDSGAAKPAPTIESPKAKVAAPSGKIAVREQVSDEELQATLESLLEKYPGVHEVQVKVENGFVTLNGLVDDDSTHDDITEFSRRLEGVRLVLNLMKTDDQVMTGTQLARREMNEIWLFFARKWLLMIVALGAVAITSMIARVFNRYSETLLSPFVGNPLLRSVLGSLIGAAIALAGVLLALSILKLTQAVLSVLGLAGVVGLAVGFAFKDITENFIASVLLGVRRPFRVGDYVTVAGQAGVVASLNTRATVLVTVDGKHVRIPNSVIYKEILVNSSASDGTRNEFDLIIPYEASTSAALEAMTSALRAQDGVIPTPAPRALVRSLEPGGVRLNATFWVPTKGVDGDQLVSDAKLKVKVALQEKGIVVSQPMTIAVAAPAAVANRAVQTPVAAPSVHREVKENIARDAHAAANSAPVADGRECAMVPEIASSNRVADEGVNLLKEPSADGKKLQEAAR